jgi:hypothetical protein
MHIKRLAENLVQTALLIFEIYKPSQFWIFCPSSLVTYPYRFDLCKKKRSRISQAWAPLIPL